MTRPSAQMVLSAYLQGAFPMADPGQADQIYWYAPDPRGIMPIQDFHIPRRLRQTLNKNPFEVTFNRDFKGVIKACAAPRAVDAETWISAGLIDVYIELHHLGFAHSVEAYEGHELVGGLYGIAIGGLFAGESMFHKRTDASKICLVYLMRRLQERRFTLCDIQFTTPHLEQFGATLIPREEYERRLQAALQLSRNFDSP